MIYKTEVPDALFPTDNEWEIPLLDPTLQADFVDAPVRGWGSVSRKSRMRGVWHFYVDDYKFTTLWKSPEQVVATDCISAVEPNFTTDSQMPHAVGIYRIYQKRWMARYWQENNIRIFVDLNVDEKFYDANLLGVPEGWRSYATSAADAHIDILHTQYEIAEKHANGQRILFLVYGGGKKVKQLCAEKHWVHIEEARNQARKQAEKENG